MKLTVFLLGWLGTQSHGVYIAIPNEQSHSTVMNFSYILNKVLQIMEELIWIKHRLFQKVPVSTFDKSVFFLIVSKIATIRI